MAAIDRGEHETVNRRHRARERSQHCLHHVQRLVWTADGIPNGAQRGSAGSIGHVHTGRHKFPPIADALCTMPGADSVPRLADMSNVPSVPNVSHLPDLPRARRVPAGSKLPSGHAVSFLPFASSHGQRLCSHEDGD